MADEIDMAEQAVEIFRNDALAKLGQKSTGQRASSGICSICGHEIEALRLTKLPFTHYCAECALELESEIKLRKKIGPKNMDIHHG